MLRIYTRGLTTELFLQAAICVVKLYDINPELVQDQGFLELVVALVSDQNPSVVANAVACLSEIAEASGHENIFGLAPGSLPKLLAALNECSEWGQVRDLSLCLSLLYLLYLLRYLILLYLLLHLPVRRCTSSTPSRSTAPRTPRQLRAPSSASFRASSIRTQRWLHTPLTLVPNLLLQ